MTATAAGADLPAPDRLDTEPNLRSRRLDAADTRAFTRLGAGARRRSAVAQVTTDWIGRVWQQAAASAPREGVALAAVGSLARGDSGPLSDIDLVLLHEGRMRPSDLDELAQRCWYPLWDSGVRLDHSVRTRQECRQVAAGDLVAAVGLLDLRWVAGDPDLVSGVRASLSHDWRANARRRLPELLDAVRARHGRHGELAHLLEPELKEARGGVRDLSIIRALAAAWLTDRPRGHVDASYERLLDVRDAVHVVTGRGRERLIRQDHDAVAALLGYSQTDQLLRDVAEAGRTIAHGLDATMRHASQSQRARTLRVGPRRPHLTPLGHGLSVHDGEVVLGPRTDPGGDPLLLLRAARAAARAGLPLGPTTIENLVAHAPAPSRPWSTTARDLFGDLLATGENVAQVWESLTLAGVIEQWIPAWGAIRSRPQHNPVHRHTVDRHSIQTVIEARPLLADVRRPDILLLAALLHDIGKAYGAQDHARLGAQPARDAVLALGLAQHEADLVALLVAQHLTLVDLATRRDPTDPRTVAMLLEAVGHDRDTLDLLCALTEADASAAGPAAWTAWRARLVDDLTQRARDRLTADGSAGSDIGTATGSPHGDPARGPEQFGAAADVAPHVRAAAQALGVQVSVEDLGEGQLVEIVAPDRVGLFADTAGLLAAQGLTVRRAALATVDGLALDRWQVESGAGARADAAVLTRSMLKLAAGDRRCLSSLSRRTAGTGGVGEPVTRALLVPEASDDATVVEVRAGDRPGLLHDLGRALAELDVSVCSAHVATYCGQGVDTVYLTEADGSRLAPGRVARVVAGLIDAADASGGSSRA